MGLLTTEHGKAGYLADFVLYAVASATLAVLLAVVAPHARRAEILAFALLGLAAWTLVEYVLHRFVLHGIQPFKAWHAEHHWRVDSAGLRQVKRHHALHHSSIAAPGRYGVSSVFWDLVFGTNGPSGGTAHNPPATS